MGLSPVQFDIGKFGNLLTPTKRVDRREGTPAVQSHNVQTEAYRAVTNGSIPVYNQPSIVGGSYGFNGPELAGKPVGKKLDFTM